jgi:hypothetical protein
VLLALILAAVFALVVGVFGAQELPSSWVARATNGVVLLQWTRSGDSLTGSASVAFVDDADPFSVQKSTAAFTGVIDASNITLTVDQGLGFSTNWNGSVRGPVLTLTYVADDGGLTTLGFTPGEVDSYNTSVRSLERSVAQALELEMQRAAIDESSGAVAGDLAALSEILEVAQSDLQAVAEDLEWMRDDLVIAHDDLQAVAAEAERYPGGNFGLVCADADLVEADAATVDADAATLDFSADIVRDDIDAIRQGIAQLDADFSRLRGDLDALSSYRPAGLPSEADVTNEIEGANGAIEELTTALDSYLAEADGIVQEAHGYAADARGVCAETGG